MKKIILSTVILCSTFCMTAQNTSATTSFGVKVNGNLTNVKLTDIPQSGSSFKPGASVSGFAKIEFNEHFALQPELQLTYTEGKNNVNNERIKFKYAGIEVPVYAIGQFSAGSGKVFIGVGPHIGYGLSVDSGKEKLPESAPDKHKIDLDHWYMGGSSMIGYEFRNKISVSAGYQMGFDLSSSGKSSTVKTQTINLGIGYRF
ncbi:MAG: PorT family protein [Candidatus Azobacteroides sp.]|nr:PorT family protein [Candidatus Azobacteroides sp.]